LITSSGNGFVDIVKLLISEKIRVNYGRNFDDNKEENSLEIAIKYRQIETIHVLLEHPHNEYWLVGDSFENVTEFTLTFSEWNETFCVCMTWICKYRCESKKV
jgi:ankyrin repeat protein